MSVPSPRLSKVALAAAAFATIACALVAACGGSSTESPWPVPPDNLVLGPEGEDGKPRGTSGAPDAGADSGPDSGPNVEP